MASGSGGRRWEDQDRQEEYEEDVQASARQMTSCTSNPIPHPVTHRYMENTEIPSVAISGEQPEPRKMSQWINQWARQEAERRKEAELASDAIDDEEPDVLRVSGSPTFHDQAPEELKNRTLFAGMDEHAKNADTADAGTFSDLRDYLSTMLPEDKHKQQLYLVRGLFVWLCHNRGDVVHGEKAGSDNPLQLLNAMALNDMRSAKAFQILCKSSGIACEMVRGTARHGISYEVGDVKTGHWNVVHIDGTWRIIYVRRAASSVEGYEEGGWIKKESDGMAVTEEINSTTGRTIRCIKEFWFCTEPWECIHYCYPDDPQWQLLPVKKQIQSVQDFLRLPWFTKYYFPLGLKLSTEQTCLLTVDGDTNEITFQMAVDKQGVTGIHLTYNLYVREDMKSSTDDITERMVLKWHDGKKNTSSFELRFPVAGTYKLEIYANIHDRHKRTICKFMIDCKRPTKNFRPLPIDPPYGWGCTYKAAEFGLVNPSWTSPKIPIEAADKNKKKSPNIASLVFTIKEDMVDSVEYKSYLYSREHTEDKHAALQKYVNTDLDARSLQLTVQASVPSAGEFALVIEASLTETDGRTTESNVPVCSYLLTTLERCHAFKIPRDMTLPTSPSAIDELGRVFAICTGKRIIDAKAILDSRDDSKRSRFIAHLQFLLTSEQEQYVAAMIAHMLNKALSHTQ